MQRYFVERSHPARITGENVHHVRHVMRMKVGDQVYLTYPDGASVVAAITDLTEDEVLLQELYPEEQQKELPIQVSIACGFPKGDKLELITQKTTELGAFEIMAFPAKTSVVKWDQKKRQNKQARLQKIAQEAAEQSHRQQIPTVRLLDQDITSRFSDYDQVLIVYEESAKQGEQAILAQVLQNLTAGERLLVVFGPEGGFTPAEIEKYQAAGARLCGLGPRILRAETAPLYVLSAASYQWELL